MKLLAEVTIMSGLIECHLYLHANNRDLNDANPLVRFVPAVPRVGEGIAFESLGDVGDVMEISYHFDEADATVFTVWLEINFGELSPEDLTFLENLTNAS